MRPESATQPTQPSLPPLPASLIDPLRRLYEEPHRHYHGLQHIHALQRHFQGLRHLAQQPDHIDAAIWYHDAIYDPKRHDNEVCSADMLRFELMSIGWLGVDVERVATMVEATHHHQAADGDTDTALFLDLDLSILAAPESDYDAYAQAVRAEYAWVPEPAYRAGRQAVLQKFLQRARLYLTPELSARWEAPARANLERELRSLRSPA